MDKKGFIKVQDGTDIYYRMMGGGEPLVFLHGNGGNSRYFIRQSEFLKKYFQLIFIDSRSHGHSGNNKKDLSFELMAEDVKEVLDALGFYKVSILGFSDGANLAMIFSKKYPDRVNKLVLNSGNLTFKGTRLISQIFTYFECGISSILKVFSKFFRNHSIVAKLLLKDLDITEEELNNFKFPTLIIVGKRDLIKPNHTRYISSLIPNSELMEIKDHGHLVAKTNSELFNNIVLTFLEVGDEG